MATLFDSAIAALLQPYLAPPADLLPRLSAYLDLLLKWNARTNLTAIREPEEIVRRHFGESLFAARHLGAEVDTLLDLGSGAGFPGVPIALLRPEVRVTLAESQNKKAAFLREVVRTLGLTTEVWAGRAEAMPTGRRFHTVALRAVDHMAVAVAAAEPRALRQVVLLTNTANAPALVEFREQSRVAIPGSQSALLLMASRG
ncbi:MAG TPA: 16S rRNA (guanine(527)-N(7))-methyltransferase RsmG [Edaphobacter sp.]|uniref:16S rRNA (guanine(527)-N(7))-methyltransferase RsmG n=1 Tax=Edaphobacter sp. TaxID=1934404 RepID=UPI002B839261|nr:16S rRNA (guanine(527)-N(7))-methyltransferase RsmG [Edaphobacter sp.]HUZ95938.1 16S rRNA (guanine(527)-N(7))-methyltransferase RsmG [Edaphobacter sp.]